MRTLQCGSGPFLQSYHIGVCAVARFPQRRLSAEEDNARRREKAMPLFVMMAIVVGSTELGLAAMVAMLGLVMAVLKRDPFGRFAVGDGAIATRPSAARPTAPRPPHPHPAATNATSSNSIAAAAPAVATAATAAGTDVDVDAAAAQAPTLLNDPGYGAMPVIENLLGSPCTYPCSSFALIFIICFFAQDCRRVCVCVCVCGGGVQT